MKRKIVSVLLCVLLLASLLPVSAMADTTASGTCGENLTWTLDGDGKLTISGTGAMTDYYYSVAPWYSSRSSIKSVTIGNGVTSIGGRAFYGCSSLKSVTIPNSVTSIGDYAFSSCGSLTGITIPNSVTSIGNYAFVGCGSLKSVTIPHGVTSIGGRAFYGCSSLTSVTIPDSVTSIDNSFFGCVSLKSFTVSESNSAYSSKDGVLFNKNKTKLVAYPAGKTNTSYTIPDSVTSIGYSAFYGCSSLTSVTIPDSVTSIGSEVFYGCSSLTSVTIPDSVTSIGYDAFSGCSSLTSVTIPDSVTSIVGGAFSGCSSLTSVTIPDSVTSIGGAAFYGCSSLTSVTIGNGVTSIGDNAFYGCSSLTSVTIGSGVTTIGNYAFYGCSSLTSVTIGNGVTSIGDNAFRGCSKLKDIAFAGSKDAWASIEKGDEAFSTSPRIHYNCTTLEGHIIPMERKDPSCTSTGYIKYSCACGYEFTELLPENHDYVFIKSVAATCSNAGYDVYKCSKCGKILNKSNGEEQLPHDYELTKAVEPTCTEHGYDVYKCTVCGTSKTETRNDELLPHDYVVTVVEPTCLKGGYTLHKCSVCGDEYKDNLAALLGHSMVEVGEKPATCTEAGHTAGVQCSRCGVVDSGMTEIKALGHDYGAWTITTEPTCTEKGEEIRNCSRCDVSETRVVDALGHTLVHHDGKAATCTEKGWEAYDTCSVCDYTTYKEIAPTGHNYIAKVFAPTCTVKGYTTYTCSDCGDSYIDDYVDSLGHDRIHHEAKAATCTEIGWEAYDTCSRCDYTTYKEIAATGHDYDAVVTEPTCTDKGYTTHTCADCGDSYVDSYTDALGHDFGEWTVTTAPTCAAKGIETRTCSRCDATETRDVDALGHDTVHHEAKAATCTEIGWEAYDTCSRCDYTTYKEIPATGHHHDAVVTAPTCTEKGYTTHTCACGDSYVDSYTDALGHSYGNWTQTKAPTCTAKGTEVRTCTRCNAAQTSDVAALGHDIIPHAAKAATCTEAGWEAYDTCSRCDYTTYKEIPATGHHHDAVVTAPTCTEKGYTTHTCACGDSYVDSYTDALGHSYGAWTQTKAPTCTAKGTETRNCTRCNAAQTRDVNALGHDYKSGKCTRCGAADPNYKPAPKAPELKITTSAGKPKIYWNAVDGAAKYWIYRSTDGKNFKYYDSTTKTSYTNNSTAIGSTYYYKVKAVGANGAKSDYSVSKGILCKPAAPTVSINRSNGKPKLSWKAVTGATKYWIYRSTDGVNFKYFDSTTKTSYTNSGAASGTKYYYRVKAVAYIDGVNVTSANSSTKSLMTSLAKPSVSITTSNGKPKLTWKAVTGADKYYIYRSTDGKNFSYFDSTTKTTYVNSGAKKNTKYYYKVKAVCASNSNANSAQSSAVSIKATK